MLRDFVYVNDRKQLWYYRSLQGHGEHLVCSSSLSDLSVVMLSITDKLLREFLKETASEIRHTPKRANVLINQK